MKSNMGEGGNLFYRHYIGTSVNRSEKFHFIVYKYNQIVNDYFSKIGQNKQINLSKIE